ncbi:MAG: NUDIX domain-containing protein, partial [Clostridiales Family XIII bacterium]|nr:NUDIX domain-containing protein [Clostridiales Family XIII bacterium]
KYAIRKRPDTGLLAGLWEFPNTEEALTAKQASARAEAWGLHPLAAKKGTGHTHVFTHIRWHMRSFTIECKDPAKTANDFIWVSPETIESGYALPAAFRPFLPLAGKAAGALHGFNRKVE